MIVKIKFNLYIFCLMLCYSEYCRIKISLLIYKNAKDVVEIIIL